MKNNVLLSVCLYLTGTSFAQGVFPNKISTGLEKVILDHQHKYKDIKGEIVFQDDQVSEYKSNIHLPGASSCVVKYYKGADNNNYSWACVFLETQNFEQAESRYKEIYDQLKNSIIKLQGQKPFILNGQYEVPNQQRKANNIIFDLIPSVGEIRKLKVELSLINEADRWKLLLSVRDEG